MQDASFHGPLDDISPRLSAIVIVPQRFELVKRTVAALQGQTICHEIELVFVVATRAAIEVPVAELQCFHSYQLVEVSNLLGLAHGNAAGVQAASAAIVVFTEDHSYPEPGWAEALLAAYEQTNSAVGPSFYNANPQNAVSWADFFLGYGDWAGPQPSGSRRHLPGHNSSYRRDILLGFDELEKWLEVESVLHWEMVRQGHHLFLAGDAHTYHTNYAHLSILSRSQFYSGQRFAAYRSAGWSAVKRLVYAAGSILIPIIRLSRLLPQMKRVDLDVKEIPGVFIILLWGLAVDSIGQMIGYLRGTGRSVHVLADYEFDRNRFI